MWSFITAAFGNWYRHHTRSSPRQFRIIESLHIPFLLTCPFKLLNSLLTFWYSLPLMYSCSGMVLQLLLKPYIFFNILFQFHLPHEGFSGYLSFALTLIVICATTKALMTIMMGSVFKHYVCFPPFSKHTNKQTSKQTKCGLSLGVFTVGDLYLLVWSRVPGEE